MLNKYLNKFKIDKLKQIEKNYKYIYIFRYNDLTNNEIIFLKKQLKKLNLNLIYVKQNLIKNKYLQLKGQNSLLYIYSNEFLIYELLNINLINLIYKIQN